MSERVSKPLTPGYAVRPATVVDAERLGWVHVEAWREAYPGIVAQKALDALDPAARADRWREWLRHPQNPMHLRLGIDPTDQIVGMIAAGPSRDEDSPTDWELRAINVLRVAQGTGLADALVADAVGDRPAHLWVLEENPRALAFYRRIGFAPDDGRKYDESLAAWELRLVRR
ncbi:MAG: GNAT family N-acetyltransferase [Micrococcales bacterium]|nr:GNAT family N-acetyltransferase [Micrococcales bacterium]